VEVRSPKGVKRIQDLHRDWLEGSGKVLLYALQAGRMAEGRPCSHGPKGRFECRRISGRLRRIEPDEGAEK